MVIQTLTLVFALVVFLACLIFYGRHLRNRYADREAMRIAAQQHEEREERKQRAAEHLEALDHTRGPVEP